MNKLTRRPKDIGELSLTSKYQRFNLLENPFPAYPFVNRDSTDKRINGNVYEMEIRKNEYDKIKNCFLRSPQTDANHLRLGYIIDTSYIGRGNGKSAFLVNLQHGINSEYCIDISDEVNKCFAVYVTPMPSGQTKSFSSLVDLVFHAILKCGVIDDALAILRLDALTVLAPELADSISSTTEDILVSNLASPDWYASNDIDYQRVSAIMHENCYIQKLSETFPLYAERRWIDPQIVNQNSFSSYYETLKPRDRLDFIFTELVYFLYAAGFNGAYVLVDDFERIPSFQTARQKTDFANELRSALFDGCSLNAINGFYNFILVLHAGVHRLVSEAWAESGMGNRAPLELTAEARHVIPFEKLTQDHAVLLLKKYLAEYRIEPNDQLLPFTPDAVYKIGELSEYNAAKMLKMAHDLLERVVAMPAQTVIDASFVDASRDELDTDSNRSLPEIGEVASEDLVKKAQVIE